MVNRISCQIDFLQLCAVPEGSFTDVDDVVVARIQSLQIPALIKRLIVDNTQRAITDVQKLQVDEFIENNVWNFPQV